MPPPVLQGVVGAATGAGIIIGTYFAFYSTAKNALKAHTDLSDGTCMHNRAVQLYDLGGGGAWVWVWVPMCKRVPSVEARVYSLLAFG